MNTLYITESGRVMVTEDGKASSKFSDRACVDYVFLIEEDTHIVYQRGESYSECDAKAGDIVVTFYENDFPNRMIIVDNKEWKENILAERAAEQKRKEEWAASNKCETCGDNAEPDCCK